jgi:hypothetical protein
MNWLPSSLGAEPKKIAILAGLLAVAGGAYWLNSGPDVPAAPVSPAGPQPAPTIPAAPAVAPRAPQAPVSTGVRVGTRGGGRSSDDFRPTLKLPEGTDVSRIDPALRLNLLAKLRSVEASGGSRSLFEFSQPPPPPPPKVKPIVPKPVPPEEPPKAVEAAKAADPPKPPPPPIPLKYYGYAGTAKSGERRAFFLNGEDIFVAAENDVVSKRYKIVRININSAVVEDTTDKHQQTLPLVEESGA